mgnify:CR=1 FL=1
MAARRPEPTVYVAPLRRRSSCRSRWLGSLSRAAAITIRHRSRRFRAGRDCRRNSATLLGPGPQARYWPPTMNPAERFMVGKEEQGSGVRDTQTWVSRTKRTLRRRGYFPPLESSPPAGGTSQNKTEVSPLRRRVPFAAMQKEPKNRRVTWLLGKTCGLRLGLSGATFPRTPCFYGGAFLKVGSPGRRGNLLNGV